ncbi:MAG: TonB-dependent receptor plug domain-containing protein [Crocinitomix sp.]|nr:TonB-dependent receptor plug domain-containing protein [Crocinitomix sp.]
MKIKITLLIAVLGFVNLLSAQVNLGTVSGYVYQSSDSTKAIALTKMWIETESGKRFTKADLDGRYKIDALKPGTYNLYAVASGFDSTVVAGVQVTSDGITTVDVYCTDDNMMTVVYVDFNAIKIEKDINRIKVLKEDLDHSLNIRDPKALLAGMSSDIQQQEGSSEVIIRGSRPGDVIYYIDGVKANDMSSIPGSAVQGLEAYTGGIPAKYGDTTGGVVVLETKGYFDLYYAWKARN